MNHSQSHGTIQLRAPHETGADYGISGVFQSFHHQRLFFTTDQPLPSSRMVSLAYDDVLFLGEVLACEPNSKGAWNILVQVEQILNGLAGLAALRQQLLSLEPAPRDRSRREQPSGGCKSLAPVLTSA